MLNYTRARARVRPPRARPRRKCNSRALAIIIESIGRVERAAGAARARLRTPDPLAPARRSLRRRIDGSRRARAPSGNSAVSIFRSHSRSATTSVILFMLST